MDGLVIGIDAACSDVLTPLFEDDCLPTLQELFEDGQSGPLKSHVPPWTPSMWPSIYTGVNPGKHGVFSFLSYDGYDWDVVNATDVREYALWELLSENGLTSVVVNVPVTHPPGEFDGALIPGYAAPERPTCHPAGLLDDVEDYLGEEYRLYPEQTESTDEARENYCDLIRIRGEAFRYLTERYDPEFGFLQFQGTDTVFHEHPGELGLVRSIYEAVDEEISKTLAAYDPEIICVVSDHGMGRYDGYGFRMNSYLESEGYVTPREDGQGMPSWEPIRDNQLRYGADGTTGDEETAHGPSILERGLGLAARVGITTRRVGRVLDRVGLHDTVAAFIPGSVIRAGQRQIDFESSRAYMRARIELGVRINLAGREPNGVVSPDEYDAVRSELIELLSGVQTPDGDRLFDAVEPRETYFWGPYAAEAVDIVTVPADFDHFLTADLLPKTFGPTGQPWNHKRHGVFSLSGMGIDTDGTATDDVSDREAAHVFDVAPTVLAALDCAVSDRMDGELLCGIEAAGSKSYPAYEERQRSTETASVEERLSNLGYLDD